MYYRYDSKGWYSGTSQTVVSNSTYKPVPNEELQEGYRYKYVRGEWVAKEIPPYVPPTPKPEYFIDITLTGGDGDDPIGILNDGVMSCTIAYVLKDADGNTVPLDGIFRVALRDSDGGIYDMILIEFIQGVGSVNYTSNMKPAMVCIDGDDLSIPGSNATISIEEDQYIKIYREL